MFIVIQKSELIANKANYRNRDTEGSGVIKGAREKGFPSPPRYIFGATKNSHLERLTI